MCYGLKSVQHGGSADSSLKPQALKAKLSAWQSKQNHTALNYSLFYNQKPFNYVVLLCKYISTGQFYHSLIGFRLLGHGTVQKSPFIHLISRNVNKNILWNTRLSDAVTAVWVLFTFITPLSTFSNAEVWRLGWTRTSCTVALQSCLSDGGNFGGLSGHALVWNSCFERNPLICILLVSPQPRLLINK